MNDFKNLANLKLTRHQIAITQDLQRRGLRVFLPLQPIREYDFLVEDRDGAIGRIGALEVAA
jgi:hypothetical protein